MDERQNQQPPADDSTGPGSQPLEQGPGSQPLEQESGPASDVPPAYAARRESGPQSDLPPAEPLGPSAQESPGSSEQPDLPPAEPLGEPDLERFAEEPESEADVAAVSAARAARRLAARKRLQRQRLVAIGVASAVLILILILGFLWPGWFVGSGGSASGNSSPDGSPTPSTTQGSGKPSPQTSGTKKPGTSATSGTPKPLRTPTAKLPLRLKVFGDSVGGDLAWAMAVKMPEHPAIKYWKFAKPSTGIVRPDFFSWPKFFRDDLAHHSYGAVIFMSGANDGQGMVVDGKAQAFGSPGWLKEYHRRVGAAMDIFLKNRVKRVYWVGMPEMGDPEFSALMADINEVSRAEAEKRAPSVRYVDAWAILDGPSGNYVAAYRQPDGVHLSDAGMFKLADEMYRIVEKEWHITKAATASPSTAP